MGGYLISGAQISSGLDCLEALLCVRCNQGSRLTEQIGVGLMVGATHTTAELMQLSQSKLVGALNNNGVGVGYVDSRFDDG